MQTNLPKGSASKAEGDSAFVTYGFLGEAGWGFNVGSSTVLTPFIGLAATNSTRESYSEGGKAGVVDTFSYDSYTANQVTGLAGLRATGMLTDVVAYRLGAGIEHDFSYSLDTFKFSGDFGKASYENDDTPADWRLVGTGGLSYLFAPNKQLSLDGYVSHFTGDAANYGVTLSFRMGM